MAKRPQVPKKTLVRDAQAAVAACAGWASRLAARRITNFLEERMQGSGLSLAQFGLMAQMIPMEMPAASQFCFRRAHQAIEAKRRRIM